MSKKSEQVIDIDRLSNERKKPESGDDGGRDNGRACEQAIDRAQDQGPLLKVKQPVVREHEILSAHQTTELGQQQGQGKYKCQLDAETCIVEHLYYFDLFSFAVNVGNWKEFLRL